MGPGSEMWPFLVAGCAGIGEEQREWEVWDADTEKAMEQNREELGMASNQCSELATCQHCLALAGTRPQEGQTGSVSTYFYRLQCGSGGDHGPWVACYLVFLATL